MAHLTTDLRPCCKNCIYLGYYDDRQASWYYCSRLGNAYDSNANKQVDHVITTVFEKRDGDIISRFYELFSPDDCSSHFSFEDCISQIDLFITGELHDALIHILRSYGKE